MAELLKLFLTEGSDPVATDPRSIRAAYRAVGQFITCARTINNAGSIFKRPIGKVIAQDVLAPTAQESRRRHNDQLFPGREFHE